MQVKTLCSMVDQDEDFAVFRVYTPAFISLSYSEKYFAYHLYRACVISRDVAFDQVAPHGLEIRRRLDGIAGSMDAPRSFTTYASRFWAYNGNYNPVSGRKYVPEPEAAGFLDHAFNHFTLPVDSILKPFILDPLHYPLLYEKNANTPERNTESDSVNLYSRQAAAADLAGFHKRHLSDSLFIKTGNRLKQEVYRSGTGDIPPGRLPETIEMIISELEMAAGFAPSSVRPALVELIRFFQTGGIEHWQRYMELAAGPGESPVDFSMGFIDKNYDTLKTRGIFGAAIWISDRETQGKITELQTQNAFINSLLPRSVSVSLRIELRKNLAANQVLCGTGAVAPFIGTAPGFSYASALSIDLKPEVVITNSPYSVVTETDIRVIREFLEGSDFAKVISAWTDGKPVLEILRKLIKIDSYADNTNIGISQSVEFLEEILRTSIALQYMLDASQGSSAVLPRGFSAAAFLDGYVSACLREFFHCSTNQELATPRITPGVFLLKRLTAAQVIEFVDFGSKVKFRISSVENVKSALRAMVESIASAIRESDDQVAEALINEAELHEFPYQDKLTAQIRELHLPSMYAAIFPEPVLVHNKMGAVINLALRYPDSLTDQMIRFAACRN